MYEDQWPADHSGYMHMSSEVAEEHGYKYDAHLNELVDSKGLIWIDSLADMFYRYEKQHGEGAVPSFDGYNLTDYYKYMVQHEYEFFEGKLPFPVANHVLKRLPPIEVLEKDPNYFWVLYDPTSRRSVFDASESDDGFAARMAAESFNR